VRGAGYGYENVSRCSGAIYDCHAIDVGSRRTEPRCQSKAGGTIAKRYQLEAQKEAVIDATIATMQDYAAQMITSVTAHRMRDSNNAAFAADPNIRGVQTLRDPTTGHTMELSDLCDHAWLNGSIEYIMSVDPSFTPNGQLNGQWDQLQPVRPEP
jgi:hypothetical protein